MTLAMSTEEREAILAGRHVGVLSVDDPGRGPLAVPVWYPYVASTVDQAAGSVAFRMAPARWRTTDYGKLG